MTAPSSFTGRTARYLWVTVAVILAIAVIANVFVHTHGTDPLSDGFGFYAWYSALACVVLVGVARLLALLLNRPDTSHDG